MTRQQQQDNSPTPKLVESGEGGIRTHEGFGPTRFRVVRNQPDSATSPGQQPYLTDGVDGSDGQV